MKSQPFLIVSFERSVSLKYPGVMFSPLTIISPIEFSSGLLIFISISGKAFPTDPIIKSLSELWLITGEASVNP